MSDQTDYRARINRVIDHIDRHLAEALDLQALAGVAHFSPWHFHRIFQALTGETLAERVRRRRLEVAAARLLAPEPTALEIALDVGFGSAEVFTRAFRAYFGVTPSAWRKGAYREWCNKHQVELSKIHQADHKANQAAALSFSQDAEVWPPGQHASKGETIMDVEVKTLPERRVAYMRHFGAYGSSSITQMWQRFGVWCAEHGLTSPRRTMYGVCQDDPVITPPEKCRYDACVEVDERFQASGEIGVQQIWGGRYACARFVGTPAEIHGAWMHFMKDWFPKSRYQPDDHQALEIYEPDFTVDPKTGAFSCLLCMPVRPL